MKKSIHNFKNLFLAFKNHSLFQLKKKNHLTFTRSYNLRFCVVATVSLLVFNGCSVDDKSAILNDESSLIVKNQTQLISDGANYGTEGFYFLPPMVKSPFYSGTFDAGLSPIVEICETEDCANILVSYSMTTGAGSEIVRLDNQEEHYIVNWHTKNTNTPAGDTYYIRIRVDDVVLGYAWVAIASKGSQLAALRANGYIAIVKNQTLPVKFRIETGISSFNSYIPDFAGIGGYIVALPEPDTRFIMYFANDGLISGGVYCCPSSVEAVRDGYPTRSLVYLPSAVYNDGSVVSGKIPDLTGVDGYILQDQSNQFWILPASDGFIISHESLGFWSSVGDARNANQTLNLVFLPDAYLEDLVD